MTLGERIRDLRRERGMTQYALAMAAGLSNTYIRDIEAGRSKHPSMQTISRLAHALDVPVATLIDGVGAPPDAGNDPHKLRASIEAVAAELGVSVGDIREIMGQYGELPREDRQTVARIIHSLYVARQHEEEARKRRMADNGNHNPRAQAD